MLTEGFELLSEGFELLTESFELLTEGFELLTEGFELLTEALEVNNNHSGIIIDILIILKKTYGIYLHFFSINFNNF